MNHILNLVQNLNLLQKKYAVYGAGKFTEKLLKSYGAFIKPEFIFDDQPKSTELLNISVLSTGDVKFTEVDEVILGSDTFQEEMQNRLQAITDIPSIDLVRYEAQYKNLSQDNYLQNNRPLTHAPFSIDLYNGLLSKINSHPGSTFVNYTAKEDKLPNRAVFVRHDIDFKNCLSNLQLLLEAESLYNINSGVYFRVDKEEYDPAEIKDSIEMCKEMNCEIGLHSVCYAQDNYLDEFRRESDLFESVTGFRAKSFTMHGLGQYRLKERSEFLTTVEQRLEEFGYNFSDNLYKYRKYDYVIEDCFIDNSKRALKFDIIHPPYEISDWQNWLILTHPSYWQK